MRVTILEGTPEEIREALPNLNPAFGQQGETSAIAITTDEKGEWGDEEEFISTEVATAALDRRPLADAQKTILKQLGAAYPEYVTARDLMETLDVTSAQFRGVMGAFGRRLAYTDEYESGAFFDQMWVADLACYKYRLPDTVYVAVLAKGLLGK